MASHVSPATEFRRLLRLHGSRIRSITVEHGVAITGRTFGTGLRLFDAREREIAKMLGHTLVTPMIEHILREHYGEVRIAQEDHGDFACCIVSKCRHGVGHARD